MSYEFWNSTRPSSRYSTVPRNVKNPIWISIETIPDWRISRTHPNQSPAENRGNIRTHAIAGKKTTSGWYPINGLWTNRRQINHERFHVDKLNFWRASCRRDGAHTILMTAAEDLECGPDTGATSTLQRRELFSGFLFCLRFEVDMWNKQPAEEKRRSAGRFCGFLCARTTCEFIRGNGRAYLPQNGYGKFKGKSSTMKRLDKSLWTFHFWIP